jgi:sugar phosphate permease
MTLGSPIAAHYGNWQAMIVTRIISGLAQGTVLPCLHTLLSKWVPPEERGRLCEHLHFYSNTKRALKKL